MRRLVAVSPTGLVSGAEVVLTRVLEAAVAAGWDVSLLSPPGTLAAQLDCTEVAHVALADLKLPTGRRAPALGRLVARSVRAAVAIRRAARAADVVLVNGFLALPALRLSRLRTPTVWIVHDVVRRPSWVRALAATKKSVTVAIAVSDAVAEPLVQLGMNVRVVRNGTPWPVEDIACRHELPPVVGCTALLTSWKGQDVLLDAVASLGREDLTVELVGGQFPKDGPYVEALHTRAERADLAGRVRFVGPLADPLARMRRWAVAVSPSVEPEAGPLAPLEAMSIGLPMVGTAHGGTAEVLGKAGLLVPPGDAASLGGAIGRLLDDGDLWEACHRAGPAQVEEGLTLDQQLRSLMAVLEGVAAGR